VGAASSSVLCHCAVACTEVTRALQLEQMLAGGGRQQQSASSVAFYAKLVRLALLGILCAYTWMWFKKNVL
jgi:hypothetical protein